MARLLPNGRPAGPMSRSRLALAKNLRENAFANKEFSSPAPKTWEDPRIPTNRTYTFNKGAGDFIAQSIIEPVKSAAQITNELGNRVGLPNNIVAQGLGTAAGEGVSFLQRTGKYHGNKNTADYVKRLVEAKASGEVTPMDAVNAASFVPFGKAGAVGANLVERGIPVFVPMAAGGAGGFIRVGGRGVKNAAEGYVEGKSALDKELEAIDSALAQQGKEMPTTESLDPHGYASGADSLGSFLGDKTIPVGHETISVPMGSLQHYMYSGKLDEAGNYVLDFPARGRSTVSPDTVVNVRTALRPVQKDTQQVNAHFSSSRTGKMQGLLADMGIDYSVAKQKAKDTYKDANVTQDIFNIHPDEIDPTTDSYRILQFEDPNNPGKWIDAGNHADHILTADTVTKILENMAGKSKLSKEDKNFAKGIYSWVNSKHNFVGLYGSANMSRQHTPATAWHGELPSDFIPHHRDAAASAEEAFVQYMKDFGVSETRAREFFSNNI